jgi:DNA-binding MarR family transcriptional regulator
MGEQSGKNEPSVWRLFFEAHGRLSRILEDELLAGQGLSFAWYDVLLHLSETPGGKLRMNELADALVWSRSWLTRRIDQMVEAGLVTREIDHADRRGAFAVLTRKGRSAFRKAAEQHLADIDRHFYRNLSEADLRTLRRALTKLLLAEGDRRSSGQPRDSEFGTSA